MYICIRERFVIDVLYSGTRASPVRRGNRLSGLILYVYENIRRAQHPHDETTMPLRDDLFGFFEGDNVDLRIYRHVGLVKIFTRHPPVYNRSGGHILV